MVVELVIVELALAVEFEGTVIELSSQPQAAPNPSRVAKRRPSMEPYVPPIMRKVPIIMMNMLQASPPFHLRPRFLHPQLSCSHIHPKGWKQRKTPKDAPTNDTRGSNMGIALAMM